ncbi:MAG TPA: GNAT family N-acetyltransferase, partial [archaeon]|nr:GNAT family N-acetyltransferase [archaeon]
FLHVRADNARAIALYEHLGYRRRMLAHYVVAAKPQV